MNFKESLETLEKSKEFSKWKGKNKDNYLAHAFTIFDTEHIQEDWQIGFYNKDNDKITVFVLGNDGKHITKNPETEAFKEEGKVIEQIDETKVKVDVSDALKAAKEIHSEKYSAHPVYKKIIILQNLEDFGIIWNITFVTRTFKTINIKIDAEKGEVKEDKIVSIIERMQPDEKPKGK